LATHDCRVLFLSLFQRSVQDLKSLDLFTMTESRMDATKGYEVDLALAKYVDDPKGLRNEMRDTYCVASGTWLTFVLVKQEVEDDIEMKFTVQGRQNEDRLVRYLMDKEGYVEDYYCRGWYGAGRESEAILESYFKRTKDGKEKKVSVMRMEFNQSISVEGVMLAAVRRSESTANMNFLTYDKVYSLFFGMTMEHREWMYISCDHTKCSCARSQMEIINFWVKRGWKLVGSIGVKRIKNLTTKLETSGLNVMLSFDESQDCWHRTMVPADLSREKGSEGPD
jgi:hypothetical protein